MWATSLPIKTIFELLKHFWFIIFSTHSFSIVYYDIISDILEAKGLNHSSLWRMMVNKDNTHVVRYLYFIPIIYKSYSMLTTLECVFKRIIFRVALISNQFSIHIFAYPME